MAFQLPYYKKYHKEWLASSGTRRMTLAERGLLEDLNCYEWEDGFIPDDLSKISRMVGATLTEVKKLWPAVREHYHTIAPGRLGSKRVQGDRAEAIRAYETHLENGRKGGRPRHLGANPTETGRLSSAKPDGNRMETGRLPGTKPIPEPEPKPEEQEIFPSELVSTGGVGGATRPPDPLTLSFCKHAKRVPKFRPKALDAELVAEVIAKARRLAPSDQAIEDEFGLWQAANTGKFGSGGEKDPITAFSKWLDQKASDWKAASGNGKRVPKEGQDYEPRPFLDGFKRFIPGTEQEFDEERWMEQQGVYAQ